MTAVQPAPAIETGPPETAADAAKRAATYDKLALQQLLAPTRARSSRAQRYQLLASAATIVPFIGIVEIGRELLAGGPPDTARLWTVVAIVIGALLVRTLAGGAALTITHFADVDLQRSLRLRIVDKLGRLPLGWFGGKSSGEVNKAVQNDVGELHFLVAHSAVENTGALATPLFGLIYCFYLDWRLGLLAMATVPFYIGIYLALGRDSRTQMERLDRGVERISATIVEFIAGVSVVKTFGQAGKAHKRFADAADEFNESFAGWIGPLVRVKAVSSVFIDTPVLLLANLAGGYWFVRSGWVTPIEVLGSTLVAVTIPAAVLTVGYSTHIKRQAAAAAGRLQRLLDTPVLPVAREPAVPQDNSIRFEDVRFSYDGENTVLHDVSLTLPAGTITALVGPSGSGKSTLATLVPRFHDVTAGAVRVGGVDVRDIAPPCCTGTSGSCCRTCNCSASASPTTSASAAPTPPMTTSSPRPRPPVSTTGSCSCQGDTTPSSMRTPTSPAARLSASASRARYWPTPRSWCSTRRPRSPTPIRRPRSRRRCRGSSPGAPCWSSRTGWARSSRPTTWSCWIRGASSNRAGMTN